MKRFSLIMSSLLVIQFILAQSVMMQLMPYETRMAYTNGTRSSNGFPGERYWQNHASYSIRAELLPEESLLKGEETVLYFNQSPDSLKSIVIRLYQNIYKKGNARQFSMGNDAVNEGMVIDWLKIDGEEVDLNGNNIGSTPTNLIVGLSTPLLPGDSLKLDIKWSYEISSKRPIRTGNYGKNKFFVAYWYPQIAVYDDIDGWDKIDYLGAVEYYNDFNDFDVRISTPGKFKVWATGTQKNLDAVYTKQVVQAFENANNSDDIIRIYSTEDCRDNKVLIQENNTWHFIANHVPDFSFASTDIANWEGSSLLVDSETGRKVFVDAVYGDSVNTFTNTAEWARKSVEYMSYEWPGYPFPYEQMTTFNNGRRGGGMETPMMANNGDPTDPAMAAGTVFHEIAHTYFPFFMGTNERKYAWMDEGWAAGLPIGFMDKLFPEQKYLERFVSRFEGINGKEREMTLMTLSYSLGSYDGYRVHAYVRPALAYHFLRDALGDSVFRACLHEYIDRWNGKHPSPYDFFTTFVNVSGAPLLWYFKPWFFDRAVADQAIKKITMDNKIVIENYGGLPLPVTLVCEYQDGTTETFRESTAVWAYGDPAIVIQADPDKKIASVVLGTERIPDVNRSNNTMSPEYQ
jgi:hypothetical protein